MQHRTEVRERLDARNQKHSRAYCSCGWKGPERVGDGAQVDARQHELVFKR